MENTDDVRWALIDLIRFLDAIHGGQYHAEFSRIAKTLDVELPMPPETDEEVEV